MRPFAWGENNHAELGAAYHGHPDGPVSCVVLDQDALAICASGHDTAVLRPGGTLQLVGPGTYGSMGDGERRSNHYLPVVPKLDTAVRALATAGSHWVALLETEAVACCGGNVWGTLGIGTSGLGYERASTAVPVFPKIDRPVIQVATGGGLVAVVCDDFTVRTWGAGSTGAIGDGLLYPETSLAPTTPHVVPGLADVAAVAVGGHGPACHVLALRKDGTVAQWGAHGPCGRPAKGDLLLPTDVAGLARIRAVAAGPTQSFALDEDGVLYAWGRNHDEELGLPACEVVATPTEVARGIKMVAADFGYSYFVREDGTPEHHGRGDVGKALGEQLTGVGWIDLGEKHAVALADHDRIDPPIQAAPYPGGLEVAWSSPSTLGRWEIWSRQVGGKWGTEQLLPASTRSVRVAAPTGIQTEVRVRRGKEFGPLIAVGVAGP